MKRNSTVVCVLATALAISLPAMALSVPGVSAAEATAPSAASPAASAISDSQENTAAFLDAFFARADVLSQASAFVVSVVQDGRVLAEKGYGVTDKTSGKPVDPADTTFRIGSVSKVFTVLALMQLVDQGKVSLQDDIQKYLGGYKLTNPFDKPVTVEMLLTHTTGFEVRDPTDANILYDPSQKPLELKEALFEIFPPVVREPGTSYMYDNFASGLVGYIVQEASGEPFNEYMIKHVFEPLGMTSSSFVQSDDLLGRLPTVYGADGTPAPVYRLSPDVIPEGSLITTASDMSRFMISFLNGGKTQDGKTILSQQSIQAMSTYHLQIDPDVPDMAYGFEAPPLPDSNGQNVIAKGGSIPGFGSFMWLLPDKKTGVFVTVNSDSDVMLRLYEEYMDRFYPGETKFGDPDYQARTQAELKKFEGTYADLRLGLLTSIKANEDGTLTSGNSAGVRATLTQRGDLLFVDEYGNPLAFKTDSQGNVLYLKYNNPGSYAAKTPAAPGFADVPADHPYAFYIHGLQSLGFYPGDPSQTFGTEETVARGEFVSEILREFQIPPSANEAVFKDVAESPYKGAIQAAAELGLISGTGGGSFEPERPIKREEAAEFVRKLLEISGYAVPDNRSFVLAPGTSKWAETSVRTLVDLEIHGPEVVKGEGGAIDFGSKRDLTRQELAAIQYLLLLPEKSLIS